MKISLNWLNDFVDIKDIDPKEISSLLTMKTAETEGIYLKKDYYSGIMTAKIIKAVKMDDTHFKCTVLADREYNVVSGAPNTRENLMTLFVKPGGYLNEVKITDKSVAGEISVGMLLSGKEAGINNDHSKLFEISDDLKEGQSISDICDYDDAVIEIDNKSLTHRPDLWGIYGFAREIAAIFNRPLKKYLVFDAKPFEELPEFPIEIRDRKLCYRYVGTALKNVSIVQSPLNIQVRLFHTGHSPKNLIVDLTNYVMTELGQPLHAFDRSRVDKIAIDTLKEDIEFKTLDKITRKLPKNTLMIQNDDKPVAVAGIMGGEDSEINDLTSSLFLESATFDAHHVRKSTVLLGLRTDSSARFEKSLDPENAITGALRFLHLMKIHQPKAVLTHRVTDINYNPFIRNTVRTEYSFIKRLIGEKIDNNRIKSILESLEFEVKEDGDMITVTAPTFRSTKDISIKEDIVEEVSRIYGFDNIIPAPPRQNMTAPILNVKVQIDDVIRDMLTYSFSMNETDSHPWYDNKFNKKISYKPIEPIELKNPISNDNTYLRTSLLPTLLKFSFENLRIFDSFSLYEIGQTFRQSGEDRVLAMILVDKKVKKGDEAQFFRMKEIIQNLTKRLTYNDVEFNDPDKHQMINPSISAEIISDKKPCGYIGALHPQINSLLDKKVNMTYCEINMDYFYKTSRIEKFKMFSVYPQTMLDFSILKPKTEFYNDFHSKVTSFTHNLVRNVKVISVYEGENIAPGYQSITFRYIVGSGERTLSAEDLSEFQKEFIAHLSSLEYKLR
ncbi:MAG: phenylalanine--tRNA ligase subunit beta [bacterium]